MTLLVPIPQDLLRPRYRRSRKDAGDASASSALQLRDKLESLDPSKGFPDPLRLHGRKIQELSSQLKVEAREQHAQLSQIAQTLSAASSLLIQGHVGPDVDRLRNDLGETIARLQSEISFIKNNLSPSRHTQPGPYYCARCCADQSPNAPHASLARPGLESPPARESMDSSMEWTASETCAHCKNTFLPIPIEYSFRVLSAAQQPNVPNVSDDGVQTLTSERYKGPRNETVKEAPVEVIREVIKEVPVEVIREVIKEVPVEVIREVPVEVMKEVIKMVEPKQHVVLVEVPNEVEVTREVIVEFPVEKVVERHVFEGVDRASLKQLMFDLSAMHRLVTDMETSFKSAEAGESQSLDATASTVLAPSPESSPVKVRVSLE